MALLRVYRFSSSALGSEAHRDIQIVWDDSRAEPTYKCNSYPFRKAEQEDINPSSGPSLIVADREGMMTRMCCWSLGRQKAIFTHLCEIYNKDLHKSAASFYTYSSNLHLINETCAVREKKKGARSRGKPHLWWIVKWKRNPVKKNKYLFHSIVKNKMNSESYSVVTAVELHRLLASGRLGATCPGCLADFVTRGCQSESPTMGMKFLSVCMRNPWLASWTVSCLTRINEGKSLYSISLGYGELMVLAGQECVIKIIRN